MAGCFWPVLQEIGGAKVMRCNREVVQGSIWCEEHGFEINVEFLRRKIRTVGLETESCERCGAELICQMAETGFQFVCPMGHAAS